MTRMSSHNRAWWRDNYNELLGKHFLRDEALRLSRATGGMSNRGVRAIIKERGALFDDLVRKYRRKGHNRAESARKAMQYIDEHLEIQVLDLHGIIMKLVNQGKLRQT